MKKGMKKDTTRIVIEASLIFLAMAVLLLFLAVVGTAMADTLYAHVDSDSVLNGRKRPSTHAEKVCYFEAGDEMLILDMENGWAKVDEGGEEEYSYVCWDYLSGGEGWPKPYRVTANGRVRVRQCPSTDGKTVGYVKDGAEVTVFFVYGGFAKTKQGFICLDYLKEAETDGDAA